MVKTKKFLKTDKKKSKNAPRLPSSPEEYLEDGVEFEEAGEKWRGGDAAKSMRFFTRAIDCYQDGLRKFPNSFDLAYNKARIQFEVTQYPKLLAQSSGELEDLLSTALESSRYALKLKPDDAETLFNTAQILTSLFETDQSGESIQLLDEALELFSTCLSIQEGLLQQSQAQQTAALASAADDDVMEMDDNDEGGVPIDASGSAGPSTEEQWASVVEPVTNATILDTLIAQLETLVILVKSINSGDDNSKAMLSPIQKYAENILTTKLAAYTDDREQEAELARANFICAFSDAQSITYSINIRVYTNTILAAYKSINLDDNAIGLCDKADAMIAYNTNIMLHPEGRNPEYLSFRWTALSSALDALGKASKLNITESAEKFSLSKIHIKRGDCELWRFQLGTIDTHPPHAAAIKNRPVLLKNAGTYYRAAETRAKSLEGQGSDAAEAFVKICIVKALQGDPSDFLTVGKLVEGGMDLVFEARESGLVTDRQMDEFGDSKYRV